MERIRNFSKPSTASSKPSTGSSKPSTASSKPSTGSSKPSTAPSKPSASSSKPSTAPSNGPSSQSKALKVKQNEFSTSYTPDKSASDFVDRKRADSADNILPTKPGSSSPKKLRPQPPKLVTSNSKIHQTDLPAVSKVPPTQSHAAQTKAKPTQYENVAAPSSKPPPIKPPPYQSLSQGDSPDYDNLTFSNRDSDVYENISIGFAGSGEGGALTGPLPPLPLTRNPVSSQPASLSYENVELGGKSKGVSGGKGGKGAKGGKSPAGGKASPGRRRAAEEKEGVVEEDDDTLFGKEGPPGMQKQETIYENFGPDKGNKLMSIEELAAHVEKLGKGGLSTEYYRIRNEPITGAYKTCR